MTFSFGVASFQIDNTIQLAISLKAYLSLVLKSHPSGQYGDLYEVENSRSHPIKRPSVPMATTRTILVDLKF